MWISIDQRVTLNAGGLWLVYRTEEKAWRSLLNCFSEFKQSRSAILIGLARWDKREASPLTDLTNLVIMLGSGKIALAEKL